MADWDVVAKGPTQTAAAPAADPWAVKAKAPKRVGLAEENLAGPSEILGAGALNAIPAAINAVSDMVHGEPHPIVPTVPVGAGGRQMIGDLSHVVHTLLSESHDPQQPDDTNIPEFGDTTKNILGHATRVAGDVAQILPAAGVVKAAAGVPGEIAASRAASAASAAADAEANPAGFRTGNESVLAPAAKTAAGPSGREAVTLTNQGVGNTLGNSAAGVPHGTPLSYDATDAARAAPNAIYGRVAQALPQGPLSETATGLVADAGNTGRITTGTPDTVNKIAALKSELLNKSGNFTGDQVINESRALRQEGGANISSDDVDKQHLGRAQLDMARALEQHIADTLPANGGVSLEQFQQARKALAQNYAVEGVMHGSDLDMQAIARRQRAEPDLMDGPLKAIADFANQHPEVTALPGPAARFSPPGFAKDVAGIDLAKPATWGKPLVGGIGRRILTGDPAAAARGAQEAFPGRPAGKFDPLPMTDLSPPPGRAFESHQPDLATGSPQRDFFGTGADGFSASPPAGGAPPPAGRPGDISLADLLSHGVEQGPSAGLSLAQEPRTYGGVPFQRNAAHEAGDLALGDHFAGTPSDNTSDLGHVLSQGVPEGIMSRTGSRPGEAQQTIDYPSGAQHMSRAANNASGESAASQEAISRTAEENASGRTRFLIDPDGKITPIAEGAAAADFKPPKGYIVAQGGGPNGKPTIIDRGGLPQSHANGLLNRAMSRPLGDEF